MKNIKSQVSMEFFILVGLAFFMVLFITVASANEIKEFSDQEAFFLIRDLALKLQKEVNIASSVEDGYERNFNLPDKLENKLDYSIITKNHTITISSPRTVFSAGIPNATGDFVKGSNKIERIEGGIYINR